MDGTSIEICQHALEEQDETIDELKVQINQYQSEVESKNALKKCLEDSEQLKVEIETLKITLTNCPLITQ